MPGRRIQVSICEMGLRKKYQVKTVNHELNYYFTSLSTWCKTNTRRCM